jgi:hypothetical protein
MPQAYANPATQSSSDDLIVRIVRQYKQEARTARKTRIARNKLNWDLYFANQDWSHKQKGQSTEFLPKLSAAAEQMSAFVKRALVQFGDWFSMELPQGSFLSPEQARALLRIFLENMAVSRTEIGSFYTLMSDSTKQGLMESLIIVKVHGQHMPTRSYKAEPGDEILGIAPALTTEESTVWRLRIDLIASEDYYPDSTGRKLYEIHSVERDYFDVLESAKNGLYDEKMVKKIEHDYAKEDEDRRLARHRGQDEVTQLTQRRRVCIDECWGTLIAPDGKIIKKDVVVAVANDKYLIRKPEPMSTVFWHGESPIIATPVLRVPHSVHHKALYDDAASLNIALNEIYNLILDGGISAVWGVRQVRAHWLQDPKQVSDGIPANATLVLNEDAPAEGKVVETVTTGAVPQEALAILNLTDRELQAASKTNDTRLGFLPPRQVKATEIIQAEQSGSVVIDGFAADLEVALIAPMLRKSWLTILQFADDIPMQDVVKAIGVNNAFKLSRMVPAERFASLGQGLGFKVMGLTATLSRARDFQKLMAMMQGIATNPVLLQAFMQRASADKMLTTIMRSLNINPESLEMSEEERAQLPQRMAQMQMLSQMLPQNGGSAPAPQDSNMQSEINSGANPAGVG